MQNINFVGSLSLELFALNTPIVSFKYNERASNSKKLNVKGYEYYRNCRVVCNCHGPSWELLIT
ncbi:hypothetical protein KN1_11020 [Stygiolobus caldivivus]|uniref:Uncharacterized protein n=1 Tax=Stygiolobus caldivivus TaxID=2824673 RepID=A0A8D5U5C2_9CREN|nr:hypothetical protein KN1_11020 [Stygiolobus caldivivus]